MADVLVAPAGSSASSYRSPERSAIIQTNKKNHTYSYLVYKLFPIFRRLHWVDREKEIYITVAAGRLISGGGNLDGLDVIVELEGLVQPQEGDVVDDVEEPFHLNTL